MAGRTLPTSFKAGRTLNLEGVVYAKGDTIPKAVVARTHGVDGLLSRRWIIPTPESKTTRAHVAARGAKPKPTSLNSAERRTLLA